MRQRENSSFKRGAGLCMLGLTAASCTSLLGIDKNYHKPDGGSGGAGGSAMTSGPESTSAAESSSTGATSSSSVAGGGEDGGASIGCTSAKDQAIVADLEAVRQEARACFSSCFSSPNRSICSEDCIKMKTGMSDACGKCWGELIDCGSENCASECVNPMNKSCDDCTEQYCNPAYRACADP